MTSIKKATVLVAFLLSGCVPMECGFHKLEIQCRSSYDN